MTLDKIKQVLTKNVENNTTQLALLNEDNINILKDINITIIERLYDKLSDFVGFQPLAGPVGLIYGITGDYINSHAVEIKTRRYIDNKECSEQLADDILSTLKASINKENYFKVQNDENEIASKIEHISNNLTARFNSLPNISALEGSFNSKRIGNNIVIFFDLSESEKSEVAKGIVFTPLLTALSAGGLDLGTADMPQNLMTRYNVCVTDPELFGFIEITE